MDLDPFLRARTLAAPATAARRRRPLSISPPAPTREPQLSARRARAGAARPETVWPGDAQAVLSVGGHRDFCILGTNPELARDGQQKVGLCSAHLEVGKASDLGTAISLL